MLSTAAFNALLKTLEEPPAHVKFIFATTEIRKVPVTVLSRCQRFDLRRIEPEVMLAHLRGIAKEGASIARGAGADRAGGRGIGARCAELMDQAIAHGAARPTAEQVRAMLGLADRGRVLDLFEADHAGRCQGRAGRTWRAVCRRGRPDGGAARSGRGDALGRVVKITPEAADDPTVGPDERARGLDLAGRLPMRVLTRMWQMLLKALEEVAQAPNAMMAAEMAVIRLTHVADLPTPRIWCAGCNRSGATGRRARPRGPGGTRRRRAAGAAGAGAGAGRRALPGASFRRRPALARRDLRGRGGADPRAARHALLVEVETDLRLVRYAPGRIEFEPGPGGPARSGRAAVAAAAILDRGALGRVGHRVGRRRPPSPRPAPQKRRAEAEARASAGAGGSGGLSRRRAIARGAQRRLRRGRDRRSGADPRG
jgi:DNA polymerase III subunit gamma/tau